MFIATADYWSPSPVRGDIYIRRLSNSRISSGGRMMPALDIYALLLGGLPMKRITLVLALLALGASASMGQAGHAGQEKNLRGLKGVRLAVAFGRADAIDETGRPAILKLVEDDAASRLQKAGIRLLRYTNEVEEAGSPQLIVYITCDKPNGFVYPLVTKVRLLQRVRLARDASIEADLATWERFGVGGPEVTVEMIRSQVSTEIDQFIQDYLAVNPKEEPPARPAPAQV